jgi:hypothetical protein
MRKDWIRTEEETKLRQLQKLIKQERKFSRSEGGELLPIAQLPIVVRKKKRLLIKPTNVVHPVRIQRLVKDKLTLDVIDIQW